MSDIKKKYNYELVESEYEQRRFFQKLFKNSNHKPETIITQLPFIFKKDADASSFSHLITLDIRAKYQIMQGKKAQLLTVFDDEQKNINQEKYERLFNQLGIFFGSEKEHISYCERNLNLMKDTFVSLVKQGIIYEDCRINHRSVAEQKTLWTDEIQWKKMWCKLYNLRYFIDTKSVSIVVPTFFPETIFADVALAVHPDDKRYKKMLKHKVIIPIINKAIPIIADETVDPTQGTGIIRVTPWHDAQGLLLAQKHGLKKDKFAIDKNWCFSKLAEDFAGKKVDEFGHNIIQNLDDIHNLESVKTVEHEVAVNKKTWERALPILCNQLFMKMENELGQIKKNIDEDQIHIFPQQMKYKIDEIIDKISYRPMTKENATGYALPLRRGKSGKSYFLCDEDILNLPQKKTKNKYMILTLIIFNLVTDGRLRYSFGIEELIDILLSKSLTGEQTTLEAYLELYSETLKRGYASQINDLKKLLEYMDKEKWISHLEKFSSQLHQILEKSVAISVKKKWFYQFVMDVLVPNDEELKQDKEKIEETLVYALILSDLLSCNGTEKRGAEKIISTYESNIFECLKIMSIWQKILGKNIFDSWYIQNIWNDNVASWKSKNDADSLPKKPKRDIFRLQAVNSQFSSEEYEAFVNKLWNAARFITHPEEKKKSSKLVEFSKIVKSVQKNIKDLDDTDLWMISKSQELYREYQDAMEQKSLAKIQIMMIESIKNDFCDKYLEIKKIKNTDYWSLVSLRCLWTYLKLLHPFIPYMTQATRELLGLEWSILNEPWENELDTIAKNYKTQLFMDIIDKFSSLRKKYDYARHDSVDICFFAPLEFLQYLRRHESTVKKLINTADISYVENERELVSYHTESIINITIGIKATPVELVQTAPNTTDLKQLVRDKEQQVQQLRIFISWLISTASDPELIKQKKREMNKLKKEMEELQYEIQKAKLDK